MNHASIKDIIESNLEGKDLPDCEVWNDVSSMLRDVGCTTDLDITAEVSMAHGLSIAMASVVSALYTTGEVMDDEFGDVLIGHAANIMDILEKLEGDIDARVADLIAMGGDAE